MSERKMAFYEIGRGQFGRDIQEQFEKAQILAAQREVDIRVKIEIIVHKPDPQEEEFIRNVSYTHNLVQPARRSIKFNVVHKDNILIRNASEDPEQLDMLDLEIHGKVVRFQQNGEK